MEEVGGTIQELRPISYRIQRRTAFKDLDDLEVLDFLDDEDEQESVRPTRKNRWKHTRLNWNDHVDLLMHENHFQREYRMSVDTFNKLHHILFPLLNRQYHKCHKGLQPVSVPIIIATGLRWHTGSRADDLKHIFGLSRTEVYNCVNKFREAVLASKELAIRMPETPDQWNDIKDGFLQKSSHGLINGCVGALDVFFQKCNAPSKKEISNVISFYSGHYESYGLNCQALCDAKLCFMYFGVVAPGSTNDNIAFPQTHDLYRTINNLPRGLFIVGDAAYSSTEQVLVPFTGSQRDDKDQDAFSYYLSQLRIRIEMAFGRLVNKFRVLKRNLECSYRTNARILMACAVLHNFIIENDCVSNDEDFFDNHILRLHDEGWYRGTTTYAPLIIEKQGCALKLVSGPDYQPSFQKGLYSAQILQKVLGVNKVIIQILMIKKIQYLSSLLDCNPRTFSKKK